MIENSIPLDNDGKETKQAETRKEFLISHCFILCVIINYTHINIFILVKHIIDIPSEAKAFASPL